MSTPESEAEGPNRVETYMERIIEIQQTVKELNAQINGIRRDARESGLNLDAFNFLVNQRMRFPDDKGARVVDQLIEYAEMTGVEFEHSREMVLASSGVAMGAQNQGGESILARAQYRIEQDEEKPTSLLARVAMAIAVTVVLMWLVN